MPTSLSTFGHSRFLAGFAVVLLSMACSEASGPSGGTGGGSELSARLTARPGTPTVAVSKGRTLLGLGDLRDGFLYVPHCYDASTPIPVVVALHGSGSSSAFWVQYEPRAEAHCFAMLAPDSRSGSWDIAEGRLGPDIAFIDRALEHFFDRVNADPGRIVLLGFSDGASYSISIGVSNGDLFDHLVAHSPGFFIPFEPLVGQPPIFISHGTSDAILPVATTRDQIVPNFLQAGYEVEFVEFDGGHVLPETVAERALDWWLGSAE